LLRNNLCDNLFKDDKVKLAATLTKELWRVKEADREYDVDQARIRRKELWPPEAANLEYCADLIHIDGLGTLLYEEASDWLIDARLWQMGDIADAETRADQIVDVARALRAGLSPSLFEKLRDALLNIDGLRPASVSDSKAARAA
jgi:hypothetical protein